MEKVQFSEEELNNMVEALDAWENKDTAGEMMNTIFSSLFDDKLSPEGREKMRQREEEEKRKREEARRMRKEQGIIMKAKLIQLKNKLAVCDLITT